MSKPMLVVLVLVALGGVYGYYSGVYNVNPVAIPASDDPNAGALAKAAKEWSPSPLWLPSYLVATRWHWTLTPAGPKGGPSATERQLDVIGYGLENRGPVGKEHRGWAFASATKKTHYRLASMAVGSAMGLIVAIILAASLGWITLRKPRKEPAEPPKPKKIYTTWP